MICQLFRLIFNRTAKALYKSEMTKVKHQNPEIDIPEWNDLPENVQRLYIKKLFRDTKSYVKEFQEFVMVRETLICSYVYL